MVKMGKPGSDRSGNAVEKSNAWFLTHHTSQKEDFSLHE